MTFVISRQYGELCGGFAACNEQLGIAIRNQREAEADVLARERADWIEVMRRCPMFVAGAVA